MNPAGLYLHIPFCKTKCHYCDFYSDTNMSWKNDFVKALTNEMKMESGFLNDVKPAIGTIYFGGGTPSLLDENDFSEIFSAISENFDISMCNEITMEANPDDLTTEYVEMLRRFPFNRISIGVQSLNDKELIAINRRHNAEQAKEVVIVCKEAGFENISIDLMYGLPGQSIDSFGRTIDMAMKLPVKHISSYALSWEEGSVLYSKLQKGELKQASDEFLETCYFQLNSILMSKDFHRYELSNFSLPGYESKHNSSYWDGTYYLGLGPGAHSYNGIVRRVNISSVEKYISGLSSGEPVRETELLDLNDKYNDFIMTRIRTTGGVLMQELENLFGISKRYYCMNNARKSLKNGLLIYENNCLKLDVKGLFVADSVCSDLIWA